MLFQATTSAISHVSHILQSVQISDKVLLTVNSNGLAFRTEHAHILQVELTLERSLFTDYSVEEEIKFTLDFKQLVESLSLNTGSQCTICYEAVGSPFILIFEDSKMIERCEFSTYINFEEDNTFELNQDEIVTEGLIKSDVLYDALKDLKDLNADEIYLYTSTSHDQNKLAIISKSELGNSILYLPADKTILESLIISNGQKDYDISSFRFSVFNMLIKSIKLSNKCKFKKDLTTLSLSLLSFAGDLPKNYSGTIIDFKILQLGDKNEQIEQFANVLEPHQPLVNGGDIELIQINQSEYSNEENNNDNDLQVPIFL